jgi:hypothetical protein
MTELLSIVDLPEGFEYPRDFVRTVEAGLLKLEPWLILEGDRIRGKLSGLRQRFPNRVLVPFGVRLDCDDVACFDIDEGGISIVHDFAGDGWERRQRYIDFETWFRQAVDDFFEFGRV